MTQKKKTEKTRRLQAVRLFLWLCFAFTAVFLLSGGGELALRSRKPVSTLPPRAAAPSPSPEKPEEKAESAEEEEDWLINLNAADSEDLQTLPGIGPAAAQAILDYREKNGPFRFPEELMDIPGIGQKRFAALEAFVFCGLETAMETEE